MATDDRLHLVIRFGEDLRDTCVIESCIVVHRWAIHATGAPQTFFYNNKLQFSELTTNRAVGSSNLSGRAI